MSASIWDPSDELVAATNGTVLVQHFTVSIPTQSVFNLTAFSYVPNTNSLSVYINGVFQRSGVDYEETSGSSLTFISHTFVLGDVVSVVGLVSVTVNTTNAANTIFSPAGSISSTNVQNAIEELDASLADKQDTLISGMSIKTVNSTSLLGSGDIAIAAPAPSLTRSARTSNTVLAAGDKGTLIDITSGTFTQTLMAASTLGSGWFCYIKNSGTGVITLDPNASEIIDGKTSLVMYPGEVFTLGCTGTEFFTVGRSLAYTLPAQTKSGALIDLGAPIVTDTEIKTVEVYYTASGSGTLLVNIDSTGTGTIYCDVVDTTSTTITATGPSFTSQVNVLAVGGNIAYAGSHGTVRLYNPRSSNPKISGTSGNAQFSRQFFGSLTPIFADRLAFTSSNSNLSLTYTLTIFR